MTKTKKLHPAVLTALLACGMMLGVYIALGIWPFGDMTVLTGDLNAQYVNYFAHFKHALSGAAGFSYGFDKSLGGGLLGIFAYYVSSPFNVVYLFIKETNFPIAAAAILLVKVVFACVFFNLYIGNKYKGIGLPGVLCALCYGFMAYNFAYAQNIMWHDVVLLLPLICLGVDRILQGKSPAFYTGFLALAILANFYIAYMACIFLVGYFALSLWLRVAASEEEGSVLSLVKKPVLGFAVGSAVAGCLSAVLVLPSLQNISASKGDIFAYSFSTEPNFPLTALPALAERLSFANFIWPDVQNGLPFLYAGLFVLPFALCFFISRRVKGREKVTAALGFLALGLSFWSKGLDVLWHGMKPPVWFLYRYSFLFGFLLCLVAAAAFARRAVHARTALISGGAVFLLFVVLAALPRDTARGRLLVSAMGVAAIALCVAAACVFKTKRPLLAKLTAVGLACIVCVELAANGFYITNRFEKYPLSTYRQFLADVGGTVDAIGKTDARAYRLDKNFYRTLNDPMMFNYHGISHFGSTMDASSDAAFENLGYQSPFMSYLYGSTAFADSVLAIKYLFSDGSRTLPAHWRQTGTAAAYPIYENPYAMPMAFTVSPAASRTMVDGESGLWDNSFAYQNALAKALGSEGNICAEVPPGSVAAATAIDGGDVKLPLTGTMPGSVDYTFNAPKGGYYYALATAPQLYEAAASVNGSYIGLLFAGDFAGVVNLGYFEEGEPIIFSLALEAEFTIDSISFAYSTPDLLQRLADSTLKNAASVALSDGFVSADVGAANGRTLLFTSIPYDAAWLAEVNGEARETIRFGGTFLAVPLEEGENRVELRYAVGGLWPGAVLSLAGLAAFAAMLVFAARRRKRDNKMR